MKATSAFTSKMAPHVARYLALKQALGREYDGVRRVLVHLDQFVTTHGGDLTAETFAGWCLTLQHLASGTRRNHTRLVRNFCLYRRRYEAASFLPDSQLFPPRHQAVRPHLFTNAEVLRLLAAINALPAAPTSPFRRENLRLAIVLLYTTCLRLGELVRLTLGDYDPHESTLLIRDSQFHKSRLMPLSIDGTREGRSASCGSAQPTDRHLA
jgi:integrase